MTGWAQDDAERQAAGLLGSGAPLDMQGIWIALALTRVGSWKAVGDHPATASVNSIVKTYAPALLAEVERLTQENEELRRHAPSERDWQAMRAALGGAPD